MLPDRIEALLSDDDLAFTPTGGSASRMPDVLAGDGRGLALAEKALDALDYHRVDGTNRWRLVRRLS